MSFLYPSFLFALAAVAIPIVIHLFNFRLYKTVYFSNVRFLKNIRQETKAKSQLRHLLVLICRILAIISLVLAFSQPYVPVASRANDNNNQEFVSIYIDNSFSMDAESKFGNLLEVCKNKAREIVEAYKLNTKFLLITNDFKLKHQHFINREQFLENLSSIKVTHSVRKFSTVFSRQKDFLVSEGEKIENKSKNTAYVLSDFQKSSFDFENVKNDTTISMHLVPLSTQPTNNLYIDSCWFETPGRKLHQAEKLFVRFISKADQYNQNIPVRLLINDSLKAISSLNIEPNSSKIIELSYTNTHTGIINGKIEINDFPITYDNTFYFSYSIADKIELLSINHKLDGINFVDALFRSDDYMNITNFTESNIKIAALKNFHTVFLSGIRVISSGLHQELLNYVSNGGTVVFFPSIEGDIVSYNKFLSSLKTKTISSIDTQRTQIQKINLKNEIYTKVFKKIDENADLPILLKHYKFGDNIRTKDEQILSAANGDKILSVTPFKKGKVYIFSIPLSIKISNFVKHPLFVPTLYNMALFSQISSQIYYTVGKDDVISFAASDFGKKFDYTKGTEKGIFHIINSNNTYDFIPRYNPDISAAQISLHLEQNIKEAGNYFVKNNGSSEVAISFNYNRSESDLTYYSSDDMSDMISKLHFSNFNLLETNSQFLTKELKDISQGKQYWKFFIILTLVFFALEIGLLRFWK